MFNHPHINTVYRCQFYIFIYVGIGLSIFVTDRLDFPNQVTCFGDKKKCFFFFLLEINSWYLLSSNCIARNSIVVNCGESSVMELMFLYWDFHEFICSMHGEGLACLIVPKYTWIIHGILSVFWTQFENYSLWVCATFSPVARHVLATFNACYFIYQIFKFKCLVFPKRYLYLLRWAFYLKQVRNVSGFFHIYVCNVYLTIIFTQPSNLFDTERGFAH